MAEEPGQQPFKALEVNAQGQELAVLVPGPRKRSLDLKMQHPEPQSHGIMVAGWVSESPTEMVDGRLRCLRASDDERHYFKLSSSLKCHPDT